MNIIIPLQFFFIPVILSWTLPNYLFKYLTKYFSNNDIIILYHLAYHVFLLPVILYNIFRNTENYKSFSEKIKKSPNSIFGYILIAVFLGLLSQYAYFKLLRNYEVTTMIPIIRGASAILLLTLGYFLFEENVNLVKIVGVILTVFGIYLISQN